MDKGGGLINNAYFVGMAAVGGPSRTESPRRQDPSKNMTVTPSERDRAADVMVAQFSALKQEMNERVDRAHRMLTYNVAVAAAISSLVVSQHVAASALLLVPATSIILALLWLDNYRGIVTLGLFLRDTLWPALQDLAPAVLLPNWDTRWTESYAGWSARLAAAAPWFLAFIVPSVIALTVTVPTWSSDARLAVAWWAEFVLIVLAALLSCIVTARFVRPYVGG